MNLNFVNNQYYNVIYHIHKNALKRLIILFISHIHKKRFKTLDNTIYFSCNQFIYLKQVLYKIQ